MKMIKIERISEATFDFHRTSFRASYWLPLDFATIFFTLAALSFEIVIWYGELAIRCFLSIRFRRFLSIYISPLLPRASELRRPLKASAVKSVAWAWYDGSADMSLLRFRLAENLAWDFHEISLGLFLSGLTPHARERYGWVSFMPLFISPPRHCLDISALPESDICRNDFISSSVAAEIGHSHFYWSVKLRPRAADASCRKLAAHRQTAWVMLCWCFDGCVLPHFGTIRLRRR